MAQSQSAVVPDWIRRRCKTSAMHEVDQTTEQMVRSVLAYAENRLRMNPVPLDKGTLPADELYERLDGVIRDTAAASRRGARRLHLGDRAERDLGGQPAVPRLHPGRPDQGQPAVRHAGVLRLDPGHLVAGGVRRDRGGEQRAAGDRRRGRACRRRRAAASSRAARRATCPRSPWRARRPRSAAPPAGCAWSSARTRTRRSSTRCGCWRWTPWWSTPPTTGSPPTPSATPCRPMPPNIAAVVCTSGTTNAGIIDDLAGVGALARERGWWFHVDGAYGGSGIFARSLRPKYNGHRAGRLVHPRPAQVVVHAVRLLRVAVPRARAGAGHPHPGRVVPRRHPHLRRRVEPVRLRLPPDPAGPRAAAVVLAGGLRAGGLSRGHRGRGVACRRRPPS